MSRSAFNAFKAQVPIEWSPRLYITLVRGLPGTRRTLDATRLRRCNRTVLHRTTPSLLGEEVGGGGDGGDVRCPETATGGAPSSPPSHCCQPYPSSSSSSHCGRPCSVAALSRPSSDDGHLVMNLDWQQCLPQSPYAFKSNTFICLGGWGSCFLSSKVTLLVLMPLPNLEVDERLIPVFYIVCISSLKDCRPSKLSPIPLSSKPLLGGSEG
ncbi:uncharacterized protein [Elaeis guineensis]|uniref:Uncharacterized protein LOC105042550 isoform X2 n=1 Tax=Elaeis guineensis var. tenera TaxID=51953 RepID=A0A6J0PHA1_ELAGV|nr:uncharacterized protein LOC105042550 isoform X2 [Elaeis guineensis]